MPHSWFQWAWFLFFFIPCCWAWVRFLMAAPKIYETLKFVSWAWRKI